MKLRRVDNPPNPYLSEHREWLVPPPPARIEVYEETAASILSHNESPDLPFNWSVNPYRGCQHACAYCYARTYHEYLGYGAGTDFDTKLVVKTNAAELLRKSLTHRKWCGETIMFCGITDCYQPIEAAYGITRQCLRVCLEHANPVSIVTKGFLIVRDVELLATLHERAGVTVMISIPFADAETCAKIEPQTPPPARRFEAIRRLSDAGLPVGVFVSPIIPGLTDRNIPEILEQAAEAGATSAAFTALRLPDSVEAVFLARLAEVMPLRLKRIVNRIRDVRGGALNDKRFGHRMRGSGTYWESVKGLFEMSRDRVGLSTVNRGCSEQRPRTRPATAPAPATVQLNFDF